MKEFDALFDIPIDVTFSGEKGEKGERGLRGFKGEDGESIKGDKGDRGEDGLNGVDGIPGLNGKDGKDGINGKNGINGKSIKGDKGDDGLSAYEIWLQEGNEGDEEKFLKSLRGKDAKAPMWHGNSYTELSEFEDVNISNPQDGDILVYNPITKNWENQSPLPQVRRVQENYTIRTIDSMIECFGNNDFTVKLPTAVGVGGKLYEIPHTGTGTITLAADGLELVGGAKCLIIYPGSVGMFPSVSVRSNNIGWVLV